MPGVEKTMREFKRGTLKSGSGKKVTSRKQAIAIAISQEKPMKKKISKPVPLGGVKKKKPMSSVPAKRTGGAAAKIAQRKVGNANTPGFAYGKKTI